MEWSVLGKGSGVFKKMHGCILLNRTKYSAPSHSLGSAGLTQGATFAHVPMVIRGDVPVGVGMPPNLNE